MFDKNVQKAVNINKELIKNNLVIFTWGNASVISKDKNHFYIKPSGVPFENLTMMKMAKIEITSGIHSSGLTPSVDTPTHLELYRHFNNIGAIIHTHSTYATAFAQAKRPIPCIGTTHSDYFYGDIPIIKDLTKEQIENNYEKNTGLKIVEYFNENKIDPLCMSAALVPNHGVFVWGTTAEQALQNAIILEKIAEMSYRTLNILNANGRHQEMDVNLLNKHFFRKHGPGKYYGQN